MKTSQPAALAAALIAMCVTISQANADNSEQPGDPAIPVGWLNAFPTVVQAGTHPTLTWGIEYPETVFEIITIDPGGVITPKTCLIMEARVLGASVQKSATEWLTVEAWLSAGGGWGRFFEGKQSDVKPTKVLYRQEIQAYVPINIGGRCFDQEWGPLYNTGSGSWNVSVLVDGDVPPDPVPAYNQDRIAAFLRPYIDDTGRIEIGPKDVILLFELDATNPTQGSFDLQDLVVLASFKSCKTNNGHGNNIDGIDTSNPGNAPFIIYDTDPTVDDEGAGGGAWPKFNG